MDKATFARKFMLTEAELDEALCLMSFEARLALAEMWNLPWLKTDLYTVSNYAEAIDILATIYEQSREAKAA